MSFHILIVDDQRDVRRVLSSGLQTLGQPIEVVEVPSAEEALLIAPRHNYNLIVTDVRLPGMSGLELVRRVRLRNPGVKIILMTGVEDRQTRRQVEDAGTFAFFYKPIEMADFLDAVERALGLVETTFTPPPLDRIPTQKDALRPAGPAAEAPRTGGLAVTPPLPALLTLAAEPGVLFAALLTTAGESVSQVGEFLELNKDPMYLPALLATAQANSNLSAALLRPNPDYSLFLDGSSVSIGLTPVGKDHLLLVVGDHSFQNSLARIGSALHSAVGELLETVMAQAVSSQPVIASPLEGALLVGEPVRAAEPASMPGDEELLAALAHVEVNPEDLAALDSLLGTSRPALKVDSVDDFWNSVVEETGSLNLNESHISYDEARDLGLAPE
jgi:CheY-like chemotaxis protein